MWACQFHKCLIASRFIHVEQKKELRKRREREVKQFKICLAPLNLIYTTNRDRREEREKNRGRKKNANWLQLVSSGLR